jgi:hypothetical protein
MVDSYEILGGVVALGIIAVLAALLYLKREGARVVVEKGKECEGTDEGEPSHHRPTLNSSPPSRAPAAAAVAMARAWPTDTQIRPCRQVTDPAGGPAEPQARGGSLGAVSQGLTRSTSSSQPPPQLPHSPELLIILGALYSPERPHRTPPPPPLPDSPTPGYSQPVWVSRVRAWAGERGLWVRPVWRGRHRLAGADADAGGGPGLALVGAAAPCTGGRGADRDAQRERGEHQRAAWEQWRRYHRR